MLTHLPESWCIGTQTLDLETPCLIVDRAKMEANLARMASLTRSAGVKLRPHVKTHKSTLLAKMQIAQGALGIAVAKLGEAEVMADAGVADIMIANQIVDPRKLARAIRLAEDKRKITFLVDTLEGAERLSHAAREAATPLPVLLEVNITDPTGERGRCGVAMADVVAVAGKVASLPHLDLEGILGYRGIPWLQGKALRQYSDADIASTAREEGELLVEIANQISAAGIDIRQIVAGSTPSAAAVAYVEGITEIQPGEYLFYDAKAVGAGICDLENCALSVRATVISTHAGRSVIDAGSKVLAADINPAMRPNARLKGFGIIRDSETLEPLEGAALTSLSEEHGVITHTDTVKLSVGMQVDIVPVHVCTAVNLAHVLISVREGKVEALWPVEARGRVW